MRGEGQRIHIDTTVDMELTAYIPSVYVKNEFQKLELYKRIAAISTRDDLEDMTDELIDRYGELPVEVIALLEIALLKNTASARYVTRIKQQEGSIQMTLYHHAPADITRLDAWLKEEKGKLVFRQEKNPVLEFNTGHVKQSELITSVWVMLDKVAALMDEKLLLI